MILSLPVWSWVAVGLLALAALATACAPLRTEAASPLKATDSAAACALPPVDEAPTPGAVGAAALTQEGIPSIDAVAPTHVETATFALG